MITKSRNTLINICVVIIMLMTAIPACTKSVPDMFSIYFVQDEPGESGLVNVGSISDAALAEKPWLTIDDIDYYDYSTHNIYLKKGVTLASQIGFDPAKPILIKPFVVVAGGERCYIGYFYSYLSSAWPPETPIIWTPQFSPEDVIHISEARFPDGEEQPDVRLDERIRTALEKSGKLNMGLTVELTAAEYIPSPDGNEITCTMRITNRGDSKIYFPDPEIMGGKTLVYYTGGIYLSNGTQSYGYQHDGSEIKKIEWQKGWYSPLAAHQTVTRTITQGNFPEVPEGKYTCRLVYGGPTDIEKSDRQLSDGRMWIGVIEVSPMEITVERSVD